VTALDDARALLARISDAPLAGVWSSAGRANLIGEHTDYNEGYVLPFAIDRRTYAAVAPRADDVIRVTSTFDPEPVELSIADLAAVFDGEPGAAVRGGEVPEWAAYPLGVAWAALAASGRAAHTVVGLDIAFASDVPVGAGLSSSAAIEGATAFALDELWQLGLEGIQLAQIGRTAENEAVGAPTGIMDQVSSMLSLADSATFLDCRTLAFEPVELGFARERLTLLVIDTRVTHAHSTGGYRDRRDACERGARLLGVPALRDVAVDDLDRARETLDDVTFRRVRHIVTENQRVLDTVRVLREHGPRAIGELLLASHASMRDDFEISVAELDTAVEASVAAGALGARMTGGGFGGAAIALVEAGSEERITDAVVRAFASAGFTEPRIFPVTPSAGAGRDI